MVGDEPQKSECRLRLGEVRCFWGMTWVRKSRAALRRELQSHPKLTTFGSGWISGVVGLLLGFGSLGLVLVLRFPGVFGTEELKAFREAGSFRGVVFGLMVIAYLSSLLSLVLREKKLLGGFGLALT